MVGLTTADTPATYVLDCVRLPERVASVTSVENVILSHVPTSCRTLDEPPTKYPFETLSDTAPRPVLARERHLEIDVVAVIVSVEKSNLSTTLDVSFVQIV